MLINQSMDLDTHHIIKNKTKDFNVLFLGRITEQKGVDTLLAAIEQISNNSLESCKFKFKIAGIGDEDIEKDIRDFVSIHRNVDYLGHVAHEKTGELYEWSDCVVVPSRYETLCKTAIEAGAYGKAVIVSDIPGPREVVLDGITGYLIKPNAKSFAASILSLASMKANDAKSFYSLGEKAQKYVIKKFSSSESYEKLYKIMSTAYMSRNSR
ncbi:MAG: glycosyltransferase [Pedobacter sp.]|nr:MAG: glycosyltransferase [Pedobacter sp.]